MNTETVDTGVTQLIHAAREGDRVCMGQLAELAEARLLPYIYRLTLNHDLAQELCQQTLVKMVESLGQLERVDRFWCWLYRHAMGQVQHYFRDRTRRHRVAMDAQSEERLAQYGTRRPEDGLDQAARLELSDIIIDAIMELRLVYRNVIILRCYEDLSYAEIGEHMACKELRARVLFYRAKRALKRQLAERGYRKEALLTALGLFGLVTLPGPGVTTTCAVKAASLQVGLMGSLMGAMGTKIGLMLSATFCVALTSFTLDSLLLGVGVLGLAGLAIVVALYIDSLSSR